MLSGQIKSGLAAKKFTGLMVLVDAYLKLNGRDQEMQTIRTRLLSRDEKLSVQTAEIVSKAEAFRESSDFKSAIKELRGIGKSQQSDETLALLETKDESHFQSEVRDARRAVDHLRAMLKTVLANLHPWWSCFASVRRAIRTSKLVNVLCDRAERPSI